MILKSFMIFCKCPSNSFSFFFLQTEEQQKNFEIELLRLSADNASLRSQLAAMSASVTGLMEVKGGKAAAEKRERDTNIGDAEKRLKELVALTKAEKERQVSSA
jgi:hypothetical protein